MPANGISLRRFVHAERARVFEAWTRPDLMARWFKPEANWNATVTAEVQVGGRYELEMRDPAGRLHVQFGEYREITPVSRLVFTWTCPELSVVDSVVTVELIDHGKRTEVLLTHVLPPNPTIRRSHEDGWQGCLSNLDQLLQDEARQTDAIDQG